VGYFSQPLVGTSALQVAELRGSMHRLIMSQSFQSKLSDVVGEEWLDASLFYDALSVTMVGSGRGII
jgi:hypothetical protein